MKDWFKNMFQLKNELFLLAAVDYCLRKLKKWVPLAKKSVTLVKVCSLFYNWLSLVSVTVSTIGKSSEQKRRFLLTGKSVSTSQNEGCR